MKEDTKVSLMLLLLSTALLMLCCYAAGCIEPEEMNSMAGVAIVGMASIAGIYISIATLINNEEK